MTVEVCDLREGSQQREFLGHPVGLTVCFLTEMWERFSYYGMRTLLTVFLVQHFLFSTRDAGLIYGAYTGLVYLLPVLGGWLADRYLGSRKAVTFGAILLTLGHFSLAFEGPQSERFLTVDGAEYTVEFVRQDSKQIQYVTIDGTRFSIDTLTNDEQKNVGIKLSSDGETKELLDGSYEFRVRQHEEFLSVFYFSLALIITGVGFLKANISTIVGALYGPHDPRRDGGFTIFYMGINLGSVLATGLCGYLGLHEDYGWGYGFGLAGIGMLAGLVVFWKYQHLLEGRADPPCEKALKKPFLGPINIEWSIYLLGIALVGMTWMLVQYQQLVGQMLQGGNLLILAAVLIYGFTRCTKEERERLMVACFLILISILFWALFEQQGTSLTLLADQQFNLDLGVMTINGPQVQLMNPLFIVMFAPVLAALWVKLNKMGWEPTTPGKFGLSLIIMGLAYYGFTFGLATEGNSKSFFWMFYIYLLMTLAELCISPVGLSMITKLSVTRIVGMMMGFWFLASALANYLAGVIAGMTGGSGHGGGGAVDVANTIEVFSQVGYLCMGVGVVVMALSTVLRKWMHGVH